MEAISCVFSGHAGALDRLRFQPLSETPEESFAFTEIGSTPFDPHFAPCELFRPLEPSFDPQILGKMYKELSKSICLLQIQMMCKRSNIVFNAYSVSIYAKDV